MAKLTETKLSKKAREGLEWGANVVEENLNFGIAPVTALRLAGIDGMEDTFFFFEFLRETGRKKLLKRLAI